MKYLRLDYSFLWILITISTFGFANFSQAATSFSVKPLIIDLETEGRDIITKDIVLKNHTSKPTRVYASVHEISPTDHSEIKEFISPSMSDRESSITSWLEISRARQELPPNGELTIPLTIKIHPNVKPGVYHAFIGFASGPNRDEIEQKVTSGQADGVILKITIAEEVNENLHVLNFTTDKFSVNEGTTKLRVVVENTGDIPLIPEGEVIIYNTRGAELAALPVNTGAEIIAPGERKEFIEDLPYTGTLGRNKAYLTLNYGAGNKAAIFDTAFYYSVPWYYFALLVLMVLLVFVTLFILLKRAYQAPDDSFENGIQDVPLFVREARDHNVFDHDINLKNEQNKD